jgi:ketosteroid isomerase-like protein
MSRQYIPPHRALISKAMERAVAVLKHREETMKIRLVVALVGLAISLALPTFAQQKEPTPSDENRQVSASLVKQGDDAWNNNDAAAVAAVFTENAVIVTDSGPIYGRGAIEKWAADLFKQIHFSNHSAKDDQVSPHAIGNELWCNGEWSQTIQGKDWGPIQQKGYYSAIDSREGDAWKLRMLTFNITPPPAAPAQTK